MRRKKAEEKNFYWKKDECIRFLAANHDAYIVAIEQWNHDLYEYNSAYKIAMDGEDSDFNPSDMLAQMGFYREPEQLEIIEKYENAENELSDILEKRDKEEGLHQSLFNYFIFTDSGNYREYSMKIVVYRNRKVYREWNCKTAR